MQLIVNGGMPGVKRWKQFKRLRRAGLAKLGRLPEQVGADLLKAHEAQTELIQDEANGNTAQITILILHAQDHLMNAITVKDLAQEFIDLYESQESRWL